jgi:hypothetical protein
MPLQASRVLKTFRYAMYFDGVDDYVEVPNSDSLNATTAITIAAWVKLRVPLSQQRAFAAVVMKYFFISPGVYTGYYLEMRGYDSRTIFVLRDSNTNYHAVYCSEPKDLDWHFVVGTYDGATQKLYIDTVLKDSISWSGTISVNTENLRLSGISDLAFNGLIYEVCVYNGHALTTSEIQQNYNNPDDPVRNGLVLWFQADPQYVKDIDNDGVLEWLDLSGFNNHGKIYGPQLVNLIKGASRTLQAQRVLPYAR